MAKHPNALRLMALALASVFAVPQLVAPSVWARNNLVVTDGPLAGSKWDGTLTPQLLPILDALAPGQPHNVVALRKSAQVGATQIGIAWMGSIIDVAPANAMIIFPTITAVQDFGRNKLAPAIEQTPALKRKVRDQVSRSSRGSTALNKSFPGGYLVLVGANSAADLRSKTVRYQHRDEIDEWPADLDGQGDPETLADARLIAFTATGDYMVFKSSTPTIKGHSKIEAAFEKGKQQHWQVPCPHCGERQKLVFGGPDVAHGLKFNLTPPHNAHYVCVNGCVIDHHHKAAMVANGIYVADNPEGLYPSFHIDSLTSRLTTWDTIAERFIAAKDNPSKLKAFINTWLGQCWEERGEAPDWQKLVDRREPYPTGTLPVGVLMLTLAFDVQKNGLFYEVVGWGADKQSWSIDAGFLDGDTADLEGPAWKQAAAIWERRYPDAYGNFWKVDLTGVDSGFNTNAVYGWVRGRPNVMALAGVGGWMKPPLGTPYKVDITFGGKKLARGMNRWPVGTWGLKADLYANLRKAPPHDGAEAFEPGFIHLGEHNDERFCRQIVAESLKTRTHRGRPVQEWVAHGDNHFHDCRIYNMALVHHLGIDRMTADQWKVLAQNRGVKPESQKELFTAALPVTARPAAINETPRPVASGRRIRSMGIT